LSKQTYHPEREPSSTLEDDDFLIDIMERVRAFIDPDSTL
jgi:hypothetical protein